MNDILALAAEVRQRYLQVYRARLSKFLEEHHPAAGELLIELQRDAALPYRLYRADMVTSEGGQVAVHELVTDTFLQFTPFGVEMADHVTAAVHPFLWSEVELHANTVLLPEPVESWALRWLDLDDAHPQDEDGLQGVIHSVLRDDGADGSTLITVDFGSAPVDALKELIELAYACGASHVSILSPSLQ